MNTLGKLIFAVSCEGMKMVYFAESIFVVDTYFSAGILSFSWEFLRIISKNRKREILEVYCGLGHEIYVWLRFERYFSHKRTLGYFYWQLIFGKKAFIYVIFESSFEPFRILFIQIQIPKLIE